MWNLRMSDYDYCLSLVFGFGYCMLLLGLCELYFWACYRVDDDHSHGTSDDHVIITINELAGIDPSLLRSIPVVDFNSKDFEDGFECAVCLSELGDGEKTRLLPTCDHCFHADCIDMWLQLHSTCPICRNKVGSVQRRTRQELGEDEGLVTQDASSAVATFSCDEHRADVTEVVADIPASP